MQPENYTLENMITWLKKYFEDQGYEAARESLQEIREHLKGSDMVFVCAGMGRTAGHL